MAEENDTFIEDDSIVLDDIDEDVAEDLQTENIIPFIMERFHRAEDYRKQDETRWLRSYRNYRGIYGPEVQFTEAEKSRVFIKVTKTKTLAAYGQIVDVLFANNKFPLTIDPTELPDGVVADVNFDPQEPEQLRTNAMEEAVSPYGFAGDGREIPAGATARTLAESLGPMADKFEGIDNLKAGVGKTPTAITFSPAMVAAKNMQKKIHDQLEESNASKHLRSTAFEMALFGTGIMKGPFAVDKEYPNWNDDGEYDPQFKTVPKVNHVSVWNFYPDPEAASMDDAEYTVERHKMSRNQLRALKSRPYFMVDAIEQAIDTGADYMLKHWEMNMEDDDAKHNSSERWEVLEFWGYVDTDILEENGVSIPAELKDLPEVNCNIWCCNGEVLRMVLNPFKPARIPYYAVPFEHNPYSFFGVGIAENMDDTQTLMNGFMRMAIDNAALSGNLIIEVDETNLVPGQDMSVYPGKVFRRQGGAPGQALFGTKFPNVAGENMQLFDKARVLADESTGFPSFAHGQTGVSGVGRTASGISMLMSAANGSIRSVVKNVDDYLIAPMGKAFFAFNMQFDFDPDIRGDLEVKASGTESLMANEVRSQRLMQFLGTVQNPALAPFAKMDYIIREIAKSMDLDPDKVTNSLQDAAIQAELLKNFQQPAPEPQQGMGPPAPPGGAPQAVAGADAMDATGGGGGQVGTGMAPAPGEEGFTGNVA